MPYFALSSGTTSGTTKHIPVSAGQMRANRGAALDMLCWHLANHPAVAALRGAVLHARRLDGAAGAGAGRAGGRPLRHRGGGGAAAAARWSWPPDRIALMPDWDAKLEALAAGDAAGEGARAVGHAVMGADAAAPDGRRRRGAAAEPRAAGAWRRRLGPLPRPLRAPAAPGCATREVYPASEGFVAIADRGDGRGMRLVLDRGLFFEFVPVGELDAPNPTRHWVADVETGVDYAVVLSSNAGLFGYVLGDVVRFVDRRPPRLLVTGGTAWMLSAFGEHVTGEEMAAALEAAARQCGAAIGEWCCGPEFLGTARPAPHPGGMRAPAPGLAAALDAALMAANEDYEAHRKGGQMAPPEVVTLRPGAFEAWMRSTGRIGGQNKVPRVIADPARFAEAAEGLRAAAR
jgi:hypothetical protein